MKRAAGLEYEEHGDGDAVLCIHGAIFSDAFAAMMLEPTLAEYRLITYRRRGYGDSDPTSEPPTMRGARTRRPRVLTHLDARPAHVIGHSGSGPIAVQLLSTTANAVSADALRTGPSERGDGRCLRRARRTARRNARAGEESAKAMDVWMVASTGDSGWRDQAEHLTPGAVEPSDRRASGTFDGDLVAMRSWDFDAVEPRPASPSPSGTCSPRATKRISSPLRSMFCAEVPHTEVVGAARRRPQLPVRPAPRTSPRSSPTSSMGSDDRRNLGAAVAPVRVDGRLEPSRPVSG